MIVVALLLAGTAGYLLFGPQAGRQALRRLRADPAERTASPVRRRSRMIMVTVWPAIPLLGAALDGGRGFWCGTAIMIVTATVTVVARRGVRRRSATRHRRAVAHSCAVLAGQVRIGQVPLVALRSAAEDCPVLTGALRTADLGGDVATHWRRQAAAPGFGGLMELARAWQLAGATGAGMAGSLDNVAAALHEDEALALVINSEAAGPRSSGKIMALLPLVGIGLGYLIGGDPIAFLFDSAAGWGCLVGGAALACSGVLWMEQVADRAGLEI